MNLEIATKFKNIQCKLRDVSWVRLPFFFSKFEGVLSHSVHGLFFAQKLNTDGQLQKYSHITKSFIFNKTEF